MFMLHRLLPHPIRRRLFGDRDRYGPAPDETDPEWQRWLELLDQTYDLHQRRSLGQRVNHLGYRVASELDLGGKVVAEIGPASLDHAAYWRAFPAHYHAIDLAPQLLQRARERLEALGVEVSTHLTGRDPRLPLDDASVDVVMTFYSLEHLHPIDAYVAEFRRVLRPGGIVCGAVPCEGGVPWGLGRFLTTRRWLRRQGVCMDKIICWEHPNFVDAVLGALDRHFRRDQLHFAPLRVPCPDLNLVSSFVYRNA